MTMPLSPKERLTLGQQRRKQMRRAEHGVWKAKARREDPLKLMEKSMHGRVPALAALKYERMEASPFGYFRGAVPVMAYDFSLAANTGILTQLCGDAHVRNLGAYAGSDGRLLFDINDFDETIPGPFEWDVKRMATSLVLAGREAGANDGNCRRGCEGFPGPISTRHGVVCAHASVGRGEVPGASSTECSDGGANSRSGAARDRDRYSEGADAGERSAQEICQETYPSAENKIQIADKTAAHL